MYGSDVEVNGAVACYRECNPYFRDSIDNGSSFRHLYVYWNESEARRNLSTYFNVIHRIVFTLNVTHLPRYNKIVSVRTIVREIRFETKLSIAHIEHKN